MAFFGRSKNNFENFNFQFLIAKLTFHRYPHIRLGEVPLNTFWIGGYGWFDIYASGILRKLKREYPNIHIVLVAAYIQQLHRGRDNFFDSFDYPAEVEAAPYKLAIPVRNRYMVKNADYIISYIYREYGGAYEAVIQAKIYKKVVINLANEKI